MKVTLAFALVGILTFAAAASTEKCTFAEISSSQNLTWCPCETGFFCAKLDVPLDYQNLYLGRASVPLIKYPAVANSSDGIYQGMILLNPGGPGASGVSEALEGAALIHEVVGSNWDIIGFDPRGMWLSEPLANCSADVFALRKNTSLSSRDVPRLSNQYYLDLIEFGRELGENCEELAGGEMDAGPHIIVDAFAATDDGKRAAKPSDLLNCYFISYGTFLGQTFASMFPERVGNAVLDGNTSPGGYLANFTSESLFHLDGIIASFFIYCFEAGPSECAYYTGTSPKDMFDRFNSSFVQLDSRKADAEGWSNATDLEAALLELKVGILTTVVSPLDYFSSFSQVLIDLESAIVAQDVAPWTAGLIPLYGQPGPSGYENPEWALGVQCSDQSNRWYNWTLEDLAPYLAQLESESIIGEVWSHGEIGCTGWSIKATEIFSGPFGGDTATPILFVSNTYDPVTPVENAISSAPNYKNAQILAIDGMGHTSRAAANLCGYEKIRAYFQSNQLPGNDSFCPLEVGPFSVLLNGTLEENIEQAGLSDLHS